MQESSSWDRAAANLDSANRALTIACANLVVTVLALVVRVALLVGLIPRTTALWVLVAIVVAWPLLVFVAWRYSGRIGR